MKDTHKKAVLVLLLATLSSIGMTYSYSLLRRNAQRDLLLARGKGEWIAAAITDYALEHGDRLPPYERWREAIQPYLKKHELVEALPYYDYSKETAGKDCSKMLSSETVLLTRTRGLPRGTKIEVYLDGLGRIARPPPPFWRKWFRKHTCPYQRPL